MTAPSRMRIKLLVSGFVGIFLNAYLKPSHSAGSGLRLLEIFVGPIIFRQAIDTVLMPTGSAIRTRYLRSRQYDLAMEHCHYFAVRTIRRFAIRHQNSNRRMAPNGTTRKRRVPPILVLGPMSPNRQCQVSDGCQQDRKTVIVSPQHVLPAIPYST